MRMSDWIARIQTQTKLAARGAADFAAAKESLQRDTVFVFPVDETATPSSVASGLVRQQVTIGVAVVISVSSHRDRRGESVSSELEDARDKVLEALLGWEPPGADPVEYRRGRLLNFAGGRIWWQDEFETKALIGES